MKYIALQDDKQRGSHLIGVSGVERESKQQGDGRSGTHLARALDTEVCCSEAVAGRFSVLLSSLVFVLCSDLL